MKLVMTNGEVDFTKSWIKAREYSPQLINEIQDANLREMYPNELVLDIESKIQADFVRKTLLSKGLAFIEYDTGSRGRHFHLLYRGLEKLEENERVLYRELVIKEYHADLAKKNGWVAMECRPHFKSGKVKTMVNNHVGFNELEEDKVKFVKERFKDRKPINTSSPSKCSKHTISSLLKSWGIDTSHNPCDTPFSLSSRKKCLSFNDEKGVWYDFHNNMGGDIMTLYMRKYNCSFKVAKENLNR